MIGVALEGGGARGAYHVGAMKALYEAGYTFDGFAGTSIGAINAAVLAQGDFEKLYDMWENIAPDMLFDEPVARMLELGTNMFSEDFSTNLSQFWDELRGSNAIRGVDTTRMKSLISTLVDEKKLRASGKEFGLVTVCVNEFKPYQLYLSDIPEGLLVDYLMASASFPGFQAEVIGKNTFLDGGLYNNCPINMLTDKGYDQVIAIRTYGPGRFHMPKTDAEITMICPEHDPGNVMSFDNAMSLRNLKFGYLDALRITRKLKGRTYYIEPDERINFGALLMSLEEDSIRGVRNGLLVPDIPARRLLFEHILPDLGSHLKLNKDHDYDDLVFAVLESAAQSLEIDPLQVFSLKDLASEIASAPSSDPITSRLPIPLPSARYTSAIRSLAGHIAQEVLRIRN